MSTSWSARRRLTHLKIGARSTAMSTQPPLPPAASHPHHRDSHDYFPFHEVGKGVLSCLDCEIPAWFGSSRQWENKHFGVLANSLGNSLTMSMTRPDVATLMIWWGLQKPLVTVLQQHGCEARELIRKCNKLETSHWSQISQIQEEKLNLFSHTQNLYT